MPSEDVALSPGRPDMASLVALDFIAAEAAYLYLFGDEQTSRSVLRGLVTEDRLEYAAECCFGIRRTDSWAGFAALQTFAQRRDQAPLHIRSLTREAVRHSLDVPPLNQRLRNMRSSLTQLGPGDLYLSRIAVLPGSQRSGLGQLLMREVFRQFRDSDAERLVLDVAFENVSAMNFYRGLGFTSNERPSEAKSSLPRFRALSISKPSGAGGTLSRPRE